MKSVKLIVLAGLLISACSTQRIERHSEAHEAQEIASYFEISKTAYRTIHALANNMTTDPEVKEILDDVLKNFDEKEHSKNIGRFLETRMSQQEIDYVVNFIRSPQGKDAQMALKNLGDPATAMMAIGFLSPESKAAMHEFILSEAAQKLGATLASKEFADLNNAYGEQLGCKYLSKNRPADFKIAQQEKKCVSE